MRNLLFMGVYAKDQQGPKSKLFVPLSSIRCLEPVLEEEYKVYFTPDVDFHNTSWEYYTRLPSRYRNEIIFPTIE